MFFICSHGLKLMFSFSGMQREDGSVWKSSAMVRVQELWLWLRTSAHRQQDALALGTGLRRPGKSYVIQSRKHFHRIVEIWIEIHFNVAVLFLPCSWFFSLHVCRMAESSTKRGLWNTSMRSSLEIQKSFGKCFLVRTRKGKDAWWNHLTSICCYLPHAKTS
jgi:hypothetical protein